MARAQSEKVGRGACPDCGASVMFRKSSGGMLTHKCDDCDSSGYATPGGAAYAARMATIKTSQPPAPDENPDPTPEPATAAKPTKKAFSLADI